MFSCFWEKVHSVFYDLTGSESRKPDQINSNGSNDFDVFKVALDQFEKIMQPVKLFRINPNATSQQSDGRTHFDINDELLDLEEEQPLRRPIGRNKAKKSASTASGYSVMDQFGEKFDCCVHVQETKAGILSRVEQKMIETQSVIQNKNRYGNLENESGRPRRRRFGANSHDEGLCSSPT
uniref:Uncharacterized protein n=1 Tax=Lactuca sativa TaxID=4236 RepID=A0A9R1WKP0_LACSA|nr:hypothetical protein LSAT_V11C100048140 [Lactuca sativa]